MESYFSQFKGLSQAELEILERETIVVRASISCPKCNYSKKFRNQFKLSEMEQMVVALKIFDWMTCSTCGELLNLDLDFEL